MGAIMVTRSEVVTKRKRFGSFLTKRGRLAHRWEKTKNSHLSNYMKDSFGDVLRRADIETGLTTNQMFHLSDHLNIPNQYGINAYYTHKTGRSAALTVDNIHVVKKTKAEREAVAKEQKELMTQIEELENKGAPLRQIKKLEKKLDRHMMPFSQAEIKGELSHLKRYLAAEGTIHDIQDETSTALKLFKQLNELGVYDSKTVNELARKTSQIYAKMNKKGIKDYRNDETFRNAVNKLLYEIHGKLHDKDDIQAIVNNKELNPKDTRAQLDALFTTRNTIIRLKNWLQGVRLIEVDRKVADHADVDYKVRGFFSEDYARVAGAWGNNYFEGAKKNQTPDATFMQIPEWEKTMVLSDPLTRIGYILGSDYAGESKKWTMRATQDLWGMEGKGVGLHAGLKVGTFVKITKPEDIKNPVKRKEYDQLVTKLQRARGDKAAFQQFLADHKGKWRTVHKNFVFIGLSGTGKSTHTVWSHENRMVQPEGFEFVGDDQLLWEYGKKVKRNGKTVYEPGMLHNMEDQYYMKSYGMPNKGDPEYANHFQKSILDAFFDHGKEVSTENIVINKDGEFDFKDGRITENGRFFIPRRRIQGSSKSSSVKGADFVVMLTRGKYYRPMRWLKDKKQAKTAYAIIESVKRAGTEMGVTGELPVRMIGANPFIATLMRHFHLENFEDCLKTNPDTEFLIVNSNRFGKKQIKPEYNFAMWEGLGQGTIPVRYDKHRGDYVPVEIPGVPDSVIDRDQAFDDPQEMLDAFTEHIIPDRDAYVRRKLPGFKPTYRAARNKKWEKQQVQAAGVKIGTPIGKKDKNGSKRRKNGSK